MPIISGGAAATAGATRLFNSTLGGAAATIDTGAGGVTAGYSHLLLIMLLRGDNASASIDTNLTFNNDTAANYDYVWTRNLTGVVASVHGEAQTAADIGQAPAASATANYAACLTVFIPSYTATTFFKQGTATCGEELVIATPSYMDMSASFAWRSTAAITRLAITASAGNFVAGSRLTVYGLT